MLELAARSDGVPANGAPILNALGFARRCVGDQQLTAIDIRNGTLLSLAAIEWTLVRVRL
ncbi:MAG: hypothetical protein ACREE9_21635 [Stellaceae bacterium]